jgi:2-polyprenyl-3-methyl-5-hydroxy-6-metoxy-1,4-benzoquinol methylase
MSTVAVCPLCSGSSQKLIQAVSYRDLAFLYRKLLNISIGQEDIDTLEYRQCPHCELRYFFPPICGDGKFYESLQRFPWYYPDDKYEFQVATRHATSGMSILEVGCGSGMFAAFLPEGCEYRGLEFNGEAIRKARERGLQVDDTNVESLAAAVPGTFDIVCAFQVLEHVANPSALLSCAASLVKPGGRIVISVPSEDSYMGHELNNLLNMPPHHVTRWRDAALVAAGKQAGLNVIQVEHEPLSALHVPHYARAMVLASLAKLGIRLPLISRFAVSRMVRWPIALIARPIGWVASTRRPSIHGHSAIAIYEKPLLRS